MEVSNKDNKALKHANKHHQVDLKLLHNWHVEISRSLERKEDTRSFASSTVDRFSQFQQEAVDEVFAAYNSYDFMWYHVTGRDKTDVVIKPSSLLALKVSSSAAAVKIFSFTLSGHGQKQSVSNLC